MGWRRKCALLGLACHLGVVVVNAALPVTHPARGVIGFALSFVLGHVLFAMSDKSYA